MSRKPPFDSDDPLAPPPAYDTIDTSAAMFASHPETQQGYHSASLDILGLPWRANGIIGEAGTRAVLRIPHGVSKMQDAAYAYRFREITSRFNEFSDFKQRVSGDDIILSVHYSSYALHLERDILQPIAQSLVDDGEIPSFAHLQAPPPPPPVEVVATSFLARQVKRDILGTPNKEWTRVTHANGGVAFQLRLSGKHKIAGYAEEAERFIDATSPSKPGEDLVIKRDDKALIIEVPELRYYILQTKAVDYQHNDKQK